MPLGFVGAVESKEELIDLHNSLNLNIITIRGRRGGSAMACAAMNAIGLIYHNE
jgi:precorrin-8X/cobalt-precorrin-8 methylmutase